jgi:hypothetical protein
VADYINKNILAQAYLHIEPEDMESIDLDAISEHLNEFLRSRTDFFFTSSADISVEFAEGSIKIYGTVLGTIAAIYSGIATYPSFREGVLLLYEDSKRLSEYVVAEGLFTTNARHQNIVRLEARTGVIGSLRKVVGLIDQARNMNGVKSADKIEEKLVEADTELRLLLSNLNSEEDLQLVRNGLKNLFEELPEVPAPPPRSFNSQIAIRRYQVARSQAVQTCTS